MIRDFAKKQAKREPVRYASAYVMRAAVVGGLIGIVLGICVSQGYQRVVEAPPGWWKPTRIVKPAVVTPDPVEPVQYEFYGVLPSGALGNATGGTEPPVEAAAAASPVRAEMRAMPTAWRVQFGPFSGNEAADPVRAQLILLGVESPIVAPCTGGLCVSVGPYASEAQGRAQQALLAKHGLNGTLQEALIRDGKT